MVMFSFGKTITCWKRNQKNHLKQQSYGSLKSQITKARYWTAEFDAGYVNIVETDVGSVFSQSGSYAEERSEQSFKLEKR